MKHANGFTVVELIITIVVIAILAMVSLVAYNGITERAEYSELQANLSSLNKAIHAYQAKNGKYPVSTTWRGDYQAVDDNFIPGLAPTYVAKTPQVKKHALARPTFLYASNGTDYKLIYIADQGGTNDKGLPALHRKDNPRLDPTRLTRAWGYWSEGYRNY